MEKLLALLYRRLCAESWLANNMTYFFIMDLSQMAPCFSVCLIKGCMGYISHCMLVTFLSMLLDRRLLLLQSF
jgi:hypothetical protein